MPEKWLPDEPPCTTLMQAASSLTIRNSPSINGRNMGKLPQGTIARIDPGDYCLMYRETFRYIRLVSYPGGIVDEPLYLVWQEVTDTGVTDWLVLHRDDCVDAPPEIPDIPEIPEDELADWAEHELKKTSASMTYLYHKFGLEQFKQLLTPELVAIMQEVIVGTSTPDVPDEPEPPPDVPEIPPQEEFPPTEPETPPVEPSPAKPRTTPFEARGNRIYHNGNLWNKFIGVTHRGLPWYGVGDVLPHSNEGQIAAQLDFDKSIGIQVVRFYCAHHKHDVNFAIPRVKRILDMLQEREMYGICVMTDGAHSGFHVADETWSRGVFGGGNERYSKIWITEKLYHIHYMAYAKSMVQAIANHPAIFTLEVANEITTIDPSMDTAYLEAMLGFFRDTVEMFNEYSPNSMTSDGAESAHQLFGYGNAYAGFNGARKLSEIVSVRTLHSYQDEKAPGEALGTTREHLIEEFKIAGVPHIWEEMNVLSTVRETDWLDKALNASAHAVVGWMLFDPCWVIGDNGDCDGLNPSKDGTGGARKHNHEGWTRAWAKNLRIAT